jgi:ATP-dependent DNA helicase DinG
VHRLPDYALNQVTNELSYADIKYQLGLIGKTENEKLLKSIDLLEQQISYIVVNNCSFKSCISFTVVFKPKTSIGGMSNFSRIRCCSSMFTTMYDIIQSSEIQDDEVHKLHFVYHFDVTPILNDLHAIIINI